MRRYTTSWNLSVEIDLIIAHSLTRVATCLSWAYKQDYWFIQTSLAICLYTLRYHSISSDRFLWRWSFPHVMFTKQSVRYSLHPLREYNNMRSWSPLWYVATEQPWLQSSWLQNLRHNSATSLPHESAGCEWFDAASDWCVGWSGTKRHWQRNAAWRRHLYSSHRRTFWIFSVTQIS